MDTTGDKAKIHEILPDEGSKITRFDSLRLDIDDEKLVQFVNSRKRKSVAFFKSFNLFDKQNKNLSYLLGKYAKEMAGRLTANETLFPYVDNVIWEGEATIVPIAMSRLPDLLVTPGSNKNESKKTADILTKIINSDVRKRDNRGTLQMSFKHLPIYYFGIIKCVWNPAKGKMGDYEFIAVHPQNIIVDHTCRTGNINDANFVIHKTFMTIDEAVARFPDNEEYFIKFITDGNLEEKGASIIEIEEVHFKYINQTKEGSEIIHGMLWKHINKILKKIKNPNWDWQGDKRIVKYDEETNEYKEVPLKQIQNMLSELGEQMFDQMGVQIETQYRNYLEQPEYPFFMMVYEQYGNMPYDETSRIEQVRFMQDIVDKRGRQITSIADSAIGRRVVSRNSGLSQSDIAKIDAGGVGTTITVEEQGSVQQLAGEQPSPALVNNLESTRNKIFQKMGANSSIRGVIESDTATTNQISRESSYSKIDDLVENTINPAAEWMARWAMQMIKLRYTPQHMKRIVGADGEVAFHRVTSDMIEDGMEVMVHASSVDKAMRKREAIEMWNTKAIDPISLYEDTEKSDPKGRAQMLIDFMNGAKDGWAEYTTKYILELDTPEKQAQALNAAPAQPAQPQPMEGMAPPPPEAPPVM